MTFARTFVASPGIKVLREGKYSQMTPRIATSVRSGSCGLPVPVGMPGLSRAPKAVLNSGPYEAGCGGERSRERGNRTRLLFPLRR